MSRPSEVGPYQQTSKRPDRDEDGVRTLAITQNITIDGAIEMIDTWFDPETHAYEEMSDVLEEIRRQDADADAMLLGRRTFEDFRSYWPEQTDDTSGITAYLNAVDKYVVSSTLTEPGWENSTVLSGDAVQEVRALKDRPGKDIVLTGSITLTHAMIEAGLVDEYRLFTYPAVQGRGRRLFPDGFRLEQLHLTGSRSFRSGVTLTTYAV
jgi:dihydrofolate reductase